MDEIWLNIHGYEGLYQVSNLGRVRSLDRHVGKRKAKGVIKKQWLNKDGYYAVGLFKEGKEREYTVHRLVAKAFIPNPDNKDTVNHKKGKLDNSANSLEWLTNMENVYHAIANRLIPNQKLSDNDVDYIRQYYKARDKTFGGKALAVKFGVDNSLISLIVNNKHRLRERIEMKLVKFENTGCPDCQRAGLLIKGIEAEDLVESRMPYVKADDAILAGKLKQPLMGFPTFVVFDSEGNEVEGKRMNGFKQEQADELVELIEFVRNN